MAMEKYGCAGAMIGRAALTNPFIFRTIFDQSRGREFKPAKREIGNYFIHYYNLISANPDRKFILHKLRIMGNWLSHGFENGSSFRRKLSSFNDVDRFIGEIIEFFDPDDKLLPVKQKENIENDTVPVGN
jgi:tRNA-dihydrouridine synthase